MNTQKMQAAALYGKQDLRIGEVDVPQIDQDELHWHTQQPLIEA